MKIAYLARVDLGKSSGVLKKIYRQIRCWQRFGHQVKLFALSRPFQNLTGPLDEQSISYWETNGYRNLFWKAVLAARAIEEWEPDVVFWRYSSHYPFYRSLLLNKFPTVIDVNSNYDQEYRVAHNRAALLFHLATKDAVYKNVAGISTLTHEIAASLERYKKPTAIIGDGIDLQKIEPLTPKDNPNPVLVCFATQNFPWVAVDKIVRLAVLRPQWTINIIGLDRKDLSELDPPANLIPHGFLDKQRYANILRDSDIALGTLGLHRIGLSEMAPLKLREYLAYGLPSIIAYKDTDIPESTTYVLQLPNTENNIVSAINEIDTFVERWMGKRIPRSQLVNIDIVEKERKRTAFFQNILSAPVSPAPPNTRPSP